MKKIYLALAICLIGLSGCSDRYSFLLYCNTRGFLDYRDLSFRECRCVADRLQSILSVEEYSRMNSDLHGNREIAINSQADIALHEAGRQCVNQFKH